MSDEAERALFEQWLQQERPRYEPRRLTSPHHRVGEYVSIELESMWRAWVASKAAFRAQS